MERFSNMGLDDFGMLVLPIVLRKKMSLKAGEIVALHPVCGMAVLKKANEDDEEWAISKVDYLGRINLSAELRQKLG
ncbi:MAG: hypothetical protein FWC76_03750 [Defluviitaleaceae bacterium]|nr:hypothetical protein [Defluviitaleaceae bacterium]